MDERISARRADLLLHVRQQVDRVRRQLADWIEVEGAFAHAVGIGRDDCPHADPGDRAAWLRGWCLGEGAR